jgi:hypothetical protein
MVRANQRKLCRSTTHGVQKRGKRRRANQLPIFRIDVKAEISENQK